MVVYLFHTFLNLWPAFQLTICIAIHQYITVHWGAT